MKGVRRENAQLSIAKDVDKYIQDRISGKYLKLDPRFLTVELNKIDNLWVTKVPPWAAEMDQTTLPEDLGK